ncbi:efflux RND transporter periplasmic adaptor subunit [Ferrimonas sp. YFM]|uniref:efflux RND transporter periplasmic adaptor subunit n=1 Tax=Ferrimonas sp. YFM TaxID=3028878 RepID=UPI00257467DB|nr:efflux RND transporter periplasmic adaptor subunit [Ferrimonas sp. YFM]BDY04564.1 hypothetical protein F0521_16050 [Ferrimonas sp. YFM]
MKRWLLVLVPVAMAAGAWGLTDKAPKNRYQYDTQLADRGVIRKQVAATGALAAVDDLVVGAQLSGQITDILADFNDQVSQGQLLAKIDDRSFAARVAQYRAQLARLESELTQQQLAIGIAEVNLDKARQDLVRGEGLVRGNNISEEELSQLRTDLSLRELELGQARGKVALLEADSAATNALLEQALIELARTEIRSPIDGVVINRTVEAGQTVASSYNTPELFVIAKDLTQMEIEAYVDESDIGLIQDGQKVSFKVDAYPDNQFHGKVRQIRQSPTVESGVVTYRVIIAVPNPNGRLLPGMTADLTIEIATARDVVRVPNSALRIGAREAAKQSSGVSKGRQGELLSQLNLTEQQREQLAQMRDEMKGDPAGRNREAMRQRMARALEQILTPEQQQRMKALQSGNLRLGHLLLSRNGETELVGVELGISDEGHTQVLGRDLAGSEVVTQVREVSL